jgi:hypothetical protein
MGQIEIDPLSLFCMTAHARHGCHWAERQVVLDTYRTPHTRRLHGLERWKMVDGGQAIEATRCRKLVPRRLGRGETMCRVFRGICFTRSSDTNSGRAGRRAGVGRERQDRCRTYTNDIRSRPTGSSQHWHWWATGLRPTGPPWRERA